MEPAPHSNPGSTPPYRPSVEAPQGPHGIGSSSPDNHQIRVGAADQPTMPPHGITSNVPEHVRLGVRDALKDLVGYLNLTQAERALILSHPLAIVRSTANKSSFHPQDNCIAINDSDHDARTYYFVATLFVRELLLPCRTDLTSHPIFQNMERRLADIIPEDTDPSEKKALVQALARPGVFLCHDARIQATQALASAAEYFLEKAPELLTPSLRDDLAAHPRKQTPPPGLFVSEDEMVTSIKRENIRRTVDASLKTSSSEDTLQLIEKTNAWLIEGVSLFQRKSSGQNAPELNEWFDKARTILLEISQSVRKTQTLFHRVPVPPSIDTCINLIQGASAMVFDAAASHSWSAPAGAALQRLSQDLSLVVAKENKVAETLKGIKKALEESDFSASHLPPAEQHKHLTAQRQQHLTTLLRTPSHEVANSPIMHLLAFDLA